MLSSSCIVSLNIMEDKILIFVNFSEQGPRFLDCLSRVMHTFEAVEIIIIVVVLSESWGFDNSSGSHYR